FHHRHRIKEVHADDAIGAAGGGRQPGNGNGGGVGSEDDLGVADAVEFAEEVSLDLQLLGGSFNDKVAGLEAGASHGRLDALERLIALLGGELLLGDFPLQVCGNGRDRAIEEALLDVAQEDAVPGPGKDVGDAIAHGARADNADSLNLHKRPMFTAGLTGSRGTPLPLPLRESITYEGNTLRYPSRFGTDGRRMDDEHTLWVGPESIEKWSIGRPAVSRPVGRVGQSVESVSQPVGRPEDRQTVRLTD